MSIKRVTLFFVLLVMAIGLFGSEGEKLTAEKILQKHIKAIEVSSKVEDMKSIKFTQYVERYRGDIFYYIERPNKIWKEYPTRGLVLMFDGKKSYVLKGKTGPYTTGVLPVDHWWHFEFDIALVFPVLYDYPVKYMGDKVIDGVRHHELKLKMPLGTVFSYFIDLKTSLISMVRLEYKNDKGETAFADRYFADYRPTGGLLMPFKNASVNRETGEKKFETYKSIEINPEKGNIHFKYKITADNIVKKAAEAMGGVDKIKSIKSLKIKSLLSDHGGPMTAELEIPGNMRNTSRGGTSLMINNGKAACLMRKSKGSKTFDKLIKIKEAEMPDFIAEPGFVFPYIFTHKTEYRGIKELKGVRYYLLKVKMPQKVTMDYYINCKTFLVSKTVAHVFYIDKWREWIRESSDYKSVDGLMYPHSFVYSWGHVDKKYEGKVMEVKINTQFPKGHFKVPEKI